jgi:hypothetical protein
VVYASSSSALATGSALTFDGTNFGIGGASAGAALSVKKAKATVQIESTTGTNAAYQAFSNTGTNFYFGIDNSTGSEFGTGAANAGVVWQGANSPIVFGVSNTEQMRLTSTSLYTASGINVSIGTSSTPSKFTVNGNSLFGRSARLSGAAGSMEITGLGITLINDLNGSNNNWSLIQNTATGSSSNILFTSGSGSMLLDTEGNLGLGTAPSAWSATYRALQVGEFNYFAVSAQEGGACEGNLTWNAYTTGNETFAYKNTGDLASRFRQSGQFSWHLAGSGTAGATIPFTQAMTLDSSGRLVIGATTAGAKLDVVTDVAGAHNLRVYNSASGTTSYTQLQLQTDTANFYIFKQGTASTGLGGASSVNLYNQDNAPMVFYTNATQQMMLSGVGNLSLTNGNLVIGTAGKGIDFSADPSAAGMTSELLDDYEEGTWTPTIIAAGGSGSPTYSSNTGFYTKIGNTVFATAFIAFTKNTLSGGVLQSGGLPFVANSTAIYPQAACYITAGSLITNPLCQVGAGSSASDILKSDIVTGAVGSVTIADLGSGSLELRYTVTYQVN